MDCEKPNSSDLTGKQKSSGADSKQQIFYDPKIVNKNVNEKCLILYEYY